MIFHDEFDNREKQGLPDGTTHEHYDTTDTILGERNPAVNGKLALGMKLPMMPFVCMPGRDSVRDERECILDQPDRI
jgi:hypothetical protein